MNDLTTCTTRAGVDTPGKGRITLYRCDLHWLHTDDYHHDPDGNVLWRCDLNTGDIIVKGA